MIEALLLGVLLWVGLALLALKLVLEKLTQKNYEFVRAWVSDESRQEVRVLTWAR
jgi:hypothetical protein